MLYILMIMKIMKMIGVMIMIKIFCDCCKNEMELTEKFDIIIKSLNPTNCKDTYYHEVCSKCAHEMLTKLFQDERVSSESSFVKKHKGYNK